MLAHVAALSTKSNVEPGRSIRFGGIGAAKSRLRHIKIAGIVTAIPKTNTNLASFGFGAMDPLLAPAVLVPTAIGSV